MTTPRGDRAAMAVIRRDHDAHLARLRAAMEATAAREAAGTRGRKAVDLAAEEGAMALYMLGACVEAILQAPGTLASVTDEGWARVAGALDRNGEARTVLREYWDRAGGRDGRKEAAEAAEGEE